MRWGVSVVRNSDLEKEGEGQTGRRKSKSRSLEVINNWAERKCRLGDDAAGLTKVHVCIEAWLVGVM